MIETPPVKEDKDSRNNRAEVLLRFLDVAKNIQAFKGKTLEEVFRSEDNIRQFIDSLTLEEFTELINGVNGILRSKPKEEWKMDGKGVTLSSVWWGENAPPHFKDKKDLLSKVFLNIKEMNAQKRSLEDIGILVGVGVSEVHPFNDGNGRTGRLLYTLLSYGINKNKLKEILDEYGRDSVDFDIQFIESVIQVNMWDKIVQEEDKNFFGLLYRDIPKEKFNEAISETAKNLFIDLLEKNRGSDMLDLVVYEWVKTNKLEELFQESGNKERSRIPLELLLPYLYDEDVKNIENRFWELKKETAELLIDSIVNPEKSEYQREDKNIKGSILAHIKKWILMHYLKSGRKEYIVLDNQV